MNKAIYPGTFDPITNGHLDIILRASKLFDSLIIAVNENSKSSFFTTKERCELIKDATSKYNNIKVESFNGLLVDFASKRQASAIVRGLRVLSDFEYEFKMALMNRSLDDAITTIYLMPNEKYTYVSSSLIKEVALLNGDISKYVPKKVMDSIQEKING